MPLAVQVGGDTSGFERAMVKAQAVAAVTGKEIARRFDNAAEDSIKSFAKVSGRGIAGMALALAPLAATVATFAAIGKAVELAKEKIEEFTAISARAQTAGVNTTFLQAWEGQAKRAGLEVDALTEALTKAKEAATERLGGGAEGANGSVLSALLGGHVAAGNITSSQAAGVTGASSQEARVKAVLDLIDRLQQAGKELAAFDIAGKVFGPKFEQAARNGIDMVSKLRAELDKPTVAIIDEAQIGRAEQLNKRLTEAQNTISTGLKPLYDDLAQLGVNHHDSWVSIVERMAAAVKWAGDLYANLKAIPGVLEQAGNASFWRQLGNALPKLPGNGGVTDITDANRNQFAAADLLRERMGNAAAIREAQRQSLDMARGVIPDKSKPPPPKEKGGGATAAESLDDIERFIAAMERSNAVLQAEFDNLGKSNIERQKAVDLAKLHAEAKDAGREATEAEIANTLRLAEANSILKDKIKAAREAQAEFKEASRELGSALSDAFKSSVIEGEKLNVVMSRLLDRLASRGIDKAFDLLFSSGGSGGLLGALFGGGARALGGPVSAGTPYLVGERGPEIIVPRMSGTVLPNEVLRNGGQGSGLTISLVSNVDARGSTMSHAELNATLDRRDRNLLATLPAHVRAARGRGQL